MRSSSFAQALTLSADLVKEFNAVKCIEVRDVKTFCARMRFSLPSTATFRARPVEYYSPAQACNPRWALPDHIAASKLDRWAAQDEYRFIFSLSDALGFEKVSLRLAARRERPAPRPDEHARRLLSAGSLRDICVLHDCGTV